VEFHIAISYDIYLSVSVGETDTNQNDTCMANSSLRCASNLFHVPILAAMWSSIGSRYSQCNSM